MNEVFKHCVASFGHLVAFNEFKNLKVHIDVGLMQELGVHGCDDLFALERAGKLDPLLRGEAA